MALLMEVELLWLPVGDFLPSLIDGDLDTDGVLSERLISFTLSLNLTRSQFGLESCNHVNDILFEICYQAEGELFLTFKLLAIYLLKTKQKGKQNRQQFLTIDLTETQMKESCIETSFNFV
jgi:hypothetical protein